jgi:hypothetical protein
LSGQVQWSASVSGIADTMVAKVEFSIDGKLLWTEQYAPYVFNGDGGYLSTTQLSNGWHVFKVRMTTKSGATTADKDKVKVQN